ncbi:hypothetical protein [Streptomyces sp. NPDC000878]
MGPDSALPAEALGVLPVLVASGVLEGELDSSVPAVGVAVGLPAAEGDALGEALVGEALGVPDGVAEAEAGLPDAEAEAEAATTGDHEGFGRATGSDVPHPHQENETTFQPPSPLPLA